MKSAPRAPRGAFDIELLEARRRIVALEVERAGSNRAVNDLLLRVWELETKLEEAVDSRARVQGEFVALVQREAQRLAEENAVIASRLAEIYASRWWVTRSKIGERLAALKRIARLP